MTKCCHQWQRGGLLGKNISLMSKTEGDGLVYDDVIDLKDCECLYVFGWWISTCLPYVIEGGMIVNISMRCEGSVCLSI